MVALWPNLVALMIIAVVYFSASVILLKKQET